MALGEMDKGDWFVFKSSDESVIGLQSNDFKHDVVLKVTGDFSDSEQKEKYCELLADKLNS